ncbi:MAG: thiamine pyrophosphate-dependent enzyme, partial [Aminivibrio sp.]|jgi:2-oxoglutarate ferredoxin oxidoreductase subunit beta
VVNNVNYGMTGGQYSGTTPRGSLTSTSPLGHVEDPFDLCALAAAAGAPFVARGSAAEGESLRRLIRQGMEKKGFALVEALSVCHTHFGRRNGIRTPAEAFKWLRDNTVRLDKKLPEDGGFALGVFADRESEDYGARYLRAAKGAGGMKP